MGNIPLHALVVHFPLVLAILVPVIVVAVLVGIRRRRLTNRSWATVPLAIALLLISGVVAQKTGSQQEERVEDVVGESAIETHEERAELFVWMSAAALVLGLAAFMARNDRARRGLEWITLAAAIVVAGAAVRVGHSGGELVYVHGAAQAYARPIAPNATEQSHQIDNDKEDDDDSEHEH
jgi:uncharacterized membrane protein